MRQLKTYAAHLILLAMTGSLFILSSCNNDADPIFGEPTIVVTASASEQMPGGKITYSIAVVAEGGLAKVDLNGTEIKSYTTAINSDAFTFEYTVPANEPLGDKSLVFTVTDKQATAKTGSESVALKVTATPIPTITVTGAITTNTTWSKDAYYLLKGNVYVQAPAELTIDPGVIIYGDKLEKGALVINRGAKIHAKGTAAMPIIFTSASPAGSRSYGDWGGVVILGKAQNNQSIKQKIEGISTSAQDGEDGYYGTGTTVGDAQFNTSSSGEFYYCRIEFAGIALSTDNELNGLTLGSVGSGTELHHIQVSYSGDDSYEWFGGTVNATYLVAYRGWDDDFDTDFGYSGNVQYGVSFRDPNLADKSGSNFFESDNDGAGSTLTPKTSVKFSNMTWYGPYVYAALSGSAASSNYQYGGHLRRNSDIQVYNTVFLGSKLEGIHFDKTGVNAVVKGNYFGKIGVSVSKSVMKETTGNNYVTANFVTDNRFAADQGTVDLSATFAGMTSTMNLDAPTAMLAAGSSLLTGAATVPASLTQKDYVGAFDATTNWMTGWTSFDPINTVYKY